MAKKRKQTNDEDRRQSRKEVLLARKQRRQTRQIRIAIIGIASLLAAVILIGVINELFIKPSSPVAVVEGEEISMREWRERVVLQRAQLIIGLENLAETFGQDIGQVQQFAGQQITLLEEPETLGQLVLDQLIDEHLIRQEAEARGITVSDADVQKEIEESFNYFAGAVPTPLPTPTETVIPTPSLTPIPTAVITEVLPTNTPFPSPTSGPTSTPLPTATAVSLESFQESFNETIDSFNELGVDEAEFRGIVRAQLYQDRLLEELAEEQELSDEAMQVSFYYITTQSEEGAEEVMASIEESGFLTAWNTIKSLPPTDTTEDSPIASEILWRTQDEIENLFGAEIADPAFNLDQNEPSEVIMIPATEEGAPDRYSIIMVSGREMRPLSESALQAAKQEVLTSWLEEQRLTGVEIFERWRANVPRRPILDRRFLLPPTPGPATPTFALPDITETPAGDVEE
jgi:hypothetical protein